MNVDIWEEIYPVIKAQDTRALRHIRASVPREEDRLTLDMIAEYLDNALATMAAGRQSERRVDVQQVA